MQKVLSAGRLGRKAGRRHRAKGAQNPRRRVTRAGSDAPTAFVGAFRRRHTGLRAVTAEEPAPAGAAAGSRAGCATIARVRAAVYTRYGPPDVVRLEDVPKPVPDDRDLLIRVRATTVNRTDCGVRGADPWIVRLFTGPRKPRHTILGSEFAGEVEAIGPAVTSFAPGDAVFGLTGDVPGAHAEYLCVLKRDSSRTSRPPQRKSRRRLRMLALGALRRAGLKRGDKILINGGTGAIGSAGVQLARHLGAEVTAVCRGEHAELVTSLGAARIIDYTRRLHVCRRASWSRSSTRTGTSRRGRRSATPSSPSG